MTQKVKTVLSTVLEESACEDSKNTAACKDCGIAVEGKKGSHRKCTNCKKLSKKESQKTKKNHSQSSDVLLQTPESEKSQQSSGMLSQPPKSSLNKQGFKNHSQSPDELLQTPESEKSQQSPGMLSQPPKSSLNNQGFKKTQSEDLWGRLIQDLPSEAQTLKFLKVFL